MGVLGPTANIEEIIAQLMEGTKHTTGLFFFLFEKTQVFTDQTSHSVHAQPVATQTYHKWNRYGNGAAHLESTLHKIRPRAM